MNIFKIPKLGEEEYFEELKKFKNGRIERIISSNNTTDWLEQKEDEYVILIKGNAEIEYEDIKIEMSSGDTLYIPRGQKHRVSYTDEECIWICIFFDE
ncbi:MAG: cupin domain-containing protein [Andreesenia angusta]|nr:cupin domain-containing protein [Andreesenia angusta]